MPFCAKCGHEQDAGSQFCEGCGSLLAKPANCKMPWLIAVASVVLLAFVVFAAWLGTQRSEKPVGTAAVSPAEDAAAASLDEEKCLANMEELAAAMQLFAADHDGRYPHLHCWVGELDEYIRTHEVFRCPADKSVGAGCSYAMNTALHDKALPEDADPATVVVIYEARQPGLNPYGDPADMFPRHPEGACCAFADGSARVVKGLPDFAT